MYNYIRFIFFYLLFFIGVTSCSDKKEEVKTAIEEISLKSLVTMDEINWDHDMFASVDLVPLEMEENSIIGEISKIELTDNYIFILDKKSMSILMYDRAGRFLRNIGSMGQSPEEYLSISSFYINEGNIYLIDPMKQKILVYDFDGRFTRSIDSASEQLSFITGVKTFNEEHLMGYTSLNWNPKCGYYLFDKECKKDLQLIYEYPFHSKKFQAIHMSDNPICSVGKDIRLIVPYSDTIYTYRDNHIVPTYILERGKKAIDHKQLSQKMGDAQQNWLLMLSNIVKNSDYTSGIKNIFETDRYLCLDFYHESLIPNTVVWDKKNKSGWHVATNVLASPAFSSIVYCRNNELIRIWNGNQISSFKSQIKNLCAQELETLPTSWTEALEECDEEEGNPMLLIYQMKQ